MCFKIQNQHVVINILVKPNAKKTAFIGISEHGLLISLHAKPHQGAANKELISYLAELFHMPKTQIILQSGQKSRYKRVMVPLTENVKKIISAKPQ
jgi:uncharacterized protein (TIGR00251 family)